MKTNPLKPNLVFNNIWMICLLGSLFLQCLGPTNDLQPLNHANSQVSSNQLSNEAIYEALKEDDVTKLNISEFINKSFKIHAVLGEDYVNLSGTLLHMAAKMGSLQICNALLSAGADANAPNSDDETPLYQAIKGAGSKYNSVAGKGQEQKFVTIADCLIKKGADINYLNEYDETYLHMAAHYGSPAMVRFLLAKKPNYIDARANCDYTALFWALSEDPSDEIATILLDAGTDVNIKDSDGKTALHWALACGYSNTSILKKMLAMGADVNAKDNEGLGTLYYAIQGGHIEVVAFLIKETELTYQSLSQEHRNVLFHHAIKEYDESQEYYGDMVAALLKEGVFDIESSDERGNTALHTVCRYACPKEKIAIILLDANANINAQNQEGKTPLHCIVETNGDDLDEILNIFKKLLEKGADVNIKDRYGRTPLYYALQNKDRADQTKVEAYVKHTAMQIEILKKYGAVAINELNEEKIYQALEKDDVAALPIGEFACQPFSSIVETNGVKETVGTTLLHMAVRKGSVAICEALSKYKEILNSQDQYGYTPLHIAVSANQQAIVDILIKNSARITVFDYLGNTPLSAAIDLNNTAIITSILNSKFTNIAYLRDFNGETYLHRAVRKGNPAIVRLLIAKGADVKAVDQSLDTPLHLAFGSNQMEIAAILLDAKADIQAKNQEGKMPLHYAAKGYYSDISVLKRLLEMEVDVNAKDRNGRTPLYYAMESGYPNVVECLLNYNATLTEEMLINGLNKGHASVIRYLLISNKLTMEWRDQNGANLLHQALQTETQERGEISVGFMVNTLLERGAAVLIDQKNNSLSNAVSPLDCAIAKGLVRTVGLMMDYQPQISNKIIQFVAKSNNTQAINYWLTKQKLFKWQDANGHNLLHYAIKASNGDLISALLKQKKIPINLIDQDGRTFLHHAVQSGRVNILTRLLFHGANTQVKDKDGLTPLAFAEKQSIISLSNILLIWDSAPTAKITINQEEVYALHAALQIRWPALITHSLKKDPAAIHIKNDQGKTAFDLACMEADLATMSLLLDHGATINLQHATKFGLFAGAEKDNRIAQFLAEQCNKPGSEALCKAYEEWKKQCCGICFSRNFSSRGSKPCGKCSFVACNACYQKLKKPTSCPGCRQKFY